MEPNGQNGVTDWPGSQWNMVHEMDLSAAFLKSTIQVFRLPGSTPWLLQTDSSHFQQYSYDSTETGTLPVVGRRFQFMPMVSNVDLSKQDSP